MLQIFHSLDDRRAQPDDRQVRFLLCRDKGVPDCPPGQPGQAGQKQQQNSEWIKNMTGAQRIIPKGNDREEEYYSGGNDSGDHAYLVPEPKPGSATAAGSERVNQLPKR
jgi:hypothetical protein